MSTHTQIVDALEKLTFGGIQCAGPLHKNDQASIIRTPFMILQVESDPHPPSCI